MRRSDNPRKLAAVLRLTALLDPERRVVPRLATPSAPRVPMRSISPAPGPPGQLVRGNAAAGSYSVEQGKQQDQHSRDENRAAGQQDTDDREHCASKQEYHPPAGPHGACEPHDTGHDGRSTRADVRKRVTDVKEHPGPLLRVGSHQTLLRTHSLPTCRINPSPSISARTVMTIFSDRIAARLRAWCRAGYAGPREIGHIGVVTRLQGPDCLR